MPPELFRAEDSMIIKKTAFIVTLSTFAALGLIRCGGEQLPAAPSKLVHSEIGLALTTEFSRLEIPNNSRPNSAKPPLDIPLDTWREKKTAKGNRGGPKTYTTRIPVRPRGLFFAKPPAGSLLIGPDGTKIPHYRHRVPNAPFWTYDKQRVTLTIPKGMGKPENGTYALRYPVAVEREASLNWEFSGITSAEEFVRSQVQSGPDSLSGLLLPAPGVVEWELTLPSQPSLEFKAGIVPPEILVGKRSDGADVVATIIANGTPTEVWSGSLSIGTFDPVSVNLDAYAQQTVTLRLESKPGATTLYDYVFLNDPAIVDRSLRPRRVVLVFADTVRYDHLSTYGYERDTAPSLDTLSASAAVFETARSVAPWTLPSTRATLTGRHPEYFDASTTLARYVREKGWASAMFAGNLYLAPNFGLHRDWGRQNVVLWPSATDIVDRAITFLDENPNRNSLLLVQFMDAHLPYIEPESHRHMYAGEPKAGLGEEFHRSTILRARLKSDEDRQYVIDRYDNNIRYINDELARLYAKLNPEDIVVFFSDHGEEFWDHGAFEHGHTLYDELLRVPLIIRAPDMPAGRITQPVSLLDITPTVLDLLDLDYEGLDGVSLVAASQGDAEALEALERRDLAFGRPLYGYERWGVIHGDEKYTTTQGREELYNLTDDPTEQTNLLKGADGEAGAPYRGYIANGLGRDADIVYRLTPSYARQTPLEDFVVTLTVPGGVDVAWVGDDPTRSSSASVVVDGDTVTATWHRSFRGSCEIFIKPTKPFSEVTHRLSMSATLGAQTKQATVAPTIPPTLDTQRTPLAQLKLMNRGVGLGFAVSPIPNEETQALSGYDPELASMLQAMGYAVGDDEEPTQDTPTTNE